MRVGGCGAKTQNHIVNTNTLAHTDMHVGGWCVSSQLCCPKGTGSLFDLKSIIVHLNNLACMWTNCMGMICRR